MSSIDFLQWRGGAGWIVLSGGTSLAVDDAHDVELDIEARALARIAYGEPIAYIWAAGDEDEADVHLSLLDEMGAPTGYLIDVLTEDDDTIRDQIKEAGMVILGDGADYESLRKGLLGAPTQAMEAAFARGGVMFGIGAGAVALGAIFHGAEREAGLGWVEKAIIVPYAEQPEQNALMRDLLAEYPDHLGIGIPTGSALALGPNQQVEAWGPGITIMLGRELAEKLAERAVNGNSEEV